MKTMERRRNDIASMYKMKEEATKEREVMMQKTASNSDQSETEHDTIMDSSDVSMQSSSTDSEDHGLCPQKGKKPSAINLQ